MKYGVCTTIDNYNMLDAAGFDYIELAGNIITKLSDEDFAHTKKIIETGRVKCCGFNASLPPEILLCGNDFNLETAKKYVELLCKRGSELKISAIGIGSPKSRAFAKGDSLDVAWSQVESFMSMLADVALPYGITVMYESLNHTESQLGLKIREGADLVQKLGKKNLKIVFDIYHMHMEQEDFAELEYALPHVHHVHIAERVGQERRYPSEDLRSYYKEALKRLVDFGYTGAICTEAFDGDVKEGALRSIALLKSIESEVTEELSKR